MLGAALSCGVGLYGFRSALVLDVALSATAVLVFATASTVLLSIKHGAQSWDAELSSKAIRMLSFSMAPVFLGASGWVFGPGLTGVFLVWAAGSYLFAIGLCLSRRSHT